jgi:heme-degrading monooxygenase HmoA
MKGMYTLLSAILLLGGIARAQEINNETKTKKMATIQKNGEMICFIDKFFVPAAAKAEFYERMRINRSLIKTLPGFLKDEAYESTDNDGNLNCVTIAQWAGKEALNKAKETVQAAYRRENFDMPAMLKRLNIIIDRNQYILVKD